MRKPHRERAAEKEKLEWEEIREGRKKRNLLFCATLFSVSVVALILSWDAWESACFAFSFGPAVYLLLLWVFASFGATIPILFAHETLFQALREVRENRKKIKELKTKRGMDNEQ